MVEVTLPQRTVEEVDDKRGVTLRIPELGGLSAPLLLTVLPSAEEDSSVHLLQGVPSKRPAAVVDVEPSSEKLPVVAERSRRPPVALFLLLAVLAVLALLRLFVRR